MPNLPAGATPGSSVDAQGHVVSPLAQQLTNRIDTRIDPAQMQTWINMGLMGDPNSSKPFKSENVDENGNPIQGFFEKPTDCPEGTTKYGENQCLPLNNPKVSGAAANAGAAGQGPSQAQQPPQPVFSGQAGQLTYTGNPLTDALLYQFNNQKSLQTGESGLFGNFAAQGQEKPSVSGRLLSGGGLIWGNGASPFGTVTPAAPAPAGGGGGGGRQAPQGNLASAVGGQTSIAPGSGANTGAFGSTATGVAQPQPQVAPQPTSSPLANALGSMPQQVGMNQFGGLARNLMQRYGGGGF